MPNLRDRLGEILASFVPTRRVTLFNRVYEPTSIAHQMTADRVHEILRSAEAGDTQDLFALYRDVVAADSHLQAEFHKRKMALLGDQKTIIAHTEEDPSDERAREICSAAVAEVKGWQDALTHLLDSTLYPVAVVEKVYRRSNLPGQAYELDRLVPVPHHLLDFTTGELMVRETSEQGHVLAQKHATDPARYIVHRGHLLTSPDWWGGPMRSLLFWWFLSANDRDWWGRFLERYGSPFMVGKYDQADDASRSILERAFGLAQVLGGLVISRETEVDLKQAAASDSGDAYEKFLAVCNREKSKLIVGHTLSADAQATGLGSGVANSQEAVRQDLRQFDAQCLAQTLRDQLFTQLLRINGLNANAPTIQWGSESTDETKALAEILVSLQNAGLRVTEEALPTLSKRLGLPVERAGSISTSEIASLATPAQLQRAATASEANDAIARSASADLAQAFGGAYAPIRQVLLSADSAQEVEQRLRSLYPDLSHARLNTLTGQALLAFAANGSVADRA